MRAFRLYSIALAVFTLGFVYSTLQAVGARTIENPHLATLQEETYGPLAVVFLVAGAVIIRRINLIRL